MTLLCELWLKCCTVRNLHCALCAFEGSRGLFKLKRETQNLKFYITLKMDSELCQIALKNNVSRTADTLSVSALLAGRQVTLLRK